MNTVDNYTTIMYAGGKYLAVYLPNHPDAFVDGYVYEHRIVASKMLGRKLKSEEHVHHKDENGLNNSPDNLMIFATNSDHIAYHHGVNVYEKDGVYYAVELVSKIENYCKDCGKLISYRALRCKKCSNKLLSVCKSNCRPDRHILKSQIRHNSFVSIGKIYGVSDNAIRKWCKYYNLPYKSSDIKNISDENWILI